MACRCCDAAADDVTVEFLPFIRLYKSCRVERLIGDDTVPASLDGTSTGGVASKDVSITVDEFNPNTKVSVRVYLPTAAASAGKRLPILVYFHGGGFMVESAASAKYHRYVNALASRAGVVAVSVDYRRVPEHRLPVAYDDSWAAVLWAIRNAGGHVLEPEPWLVKHGDPLRVFLAGDDVGANIVHHAAMRAGDEWVPGIRGVLLMHPYFWDASGAMEPELEERIHREWMLMTGRADARLSDPRLSPMSDEYGAPPLKWLAADRVLVAVARKHFLAPKGRAYVAALLNSGWLGEAELVETPGEQHVLHLDQPGTAVAEELMDRVLAFIARPPRVIPDPE